MIVTHPVIDADAKIDFFAGDKRTFQLLKSVYCSLSENRQGCFYVASYMNTENIPTQKFNGSKLDGFNPLVVASYKDLSSIFYAADERPFIYVETENPKDERGLLNVVSLFLCIDERAYNYRKLTHREVERIDNPDKISASIESFIKGKEPVFIDRINNHSVGLVYVSFGHKAASSIKRCIASLKRLGYLYEVAVIGDFEKDENWADGYGCNLKWEGINPYDTSKAKNFQFRFGRIKPYVYKYSPFEYTLYMDADTRFMQSINDGFSFLDEYDLAVTEEKLTLRQLYNKQLAGWEINLQEREITIAELGGDDSRKFINSGVFFFKQSKKLSKLFEDWGRQWLRFQEWDEQLAFMRSIHLHPEINVKYLPVQWNDPHPNENSIIFHNYGRGEVRMNY